MFALHTFAYTFKSSYQSFFLRTFNGLLNNASDPIENTLPELFRAEQQPFPNIFCPISLQAILSFFLMYKESVGCFDKKLFAPNCLVLGIYGQ